MVVPQIMRPCTLLLRHDDRCVNSPDVETLASTLAGRAKSVPLVALDLGRVSTEFLDVLAHPDLVQDQDAETL